MIVHILVNLIQLIGIWVPFIGCVCLLRKPYNRTAMYLLLANLGCMLLNGSYLALLQTIIALKMEYFGSETFYLMPALFL